MRTGVSLQEAEDPGHWENVLEKHVGDRDTSTGGS